MSQSTPPGSMPPDSSGGPLGDDPSNVSRRDFMVAAGAVAGAVGVGLPARSFAAPDPEQVAAPRLQAVVLTVNGVRQEVSIDTRQSLLDVLRENLHLTGTKKGCNQGACGACTVLVEGRRVVSCLALAALHDGTSIQTIEGLSSGETLHPLQKAFIDHDGFQCGFCTSGQIMSGVACIREGHASSVREVQYWMSGNICRCGAYAGITSAIHETASKGRK